MAEGEPLRIDTGTQTEKSAEDGAVDVLPRAEVEKTLEKAMQLCKDRVQEVHEMYEEQVADLRLALDCTGKVLSTDLGRFWIQLPAVKKKRSEEAAAELKEKYDEDYRCFREKGGTEPKRPASAYFLWADFLCRAGRISPSM